VTMPFHSPLGTMLTWSGVLSVSTSLLGLLPRSAASSSQLHLPPLLFSLDFSMGFVGGDPKRSASVMTSTMGVSVTSLIVPPKRSKRKINAMAKVSVRRNSEHVLARVGGLVMIVSDDNALRGVQ